MVIVVLMNLINHKVGAVAHELSKGATAQD